MSNAEQERSEARKALQTSGITSIYCVITDDATEEGSLYCGEDFIGHIYGPDYVTLLENAPTWLRNSLDREEQLITALKEILRVTADGSIPDEWNGSTGGSGHAECRRIANRALNQT